MIDLQIFWSRNMELPTDLGRYPNLEADELPTRGLTLHDLGELIRRVGNQNGFIAVSEFKPVKSWRKKIDWVWLRKGDRKPIAAFEIEGRDGALESLESDREKLMKSGCKLRYLLLFQVDHDHRPKKGNMDTCVKRARDNLSDETISVLRDSDLFENRTIEEIVKNAKKISLQK